MYLASNDLEIYTFCYLRLLLQYAAVYVKKHLIESLVAKIKVLKLLTHKQKINKDALVRTVTRSVSLLAWELFICNGKGPFTNYVTLILLFLDQQATCRNAFAIILQMNYHTRVCNSNAFTNYPSTPSALRNL